MNVKELDKELLLHKAKLNIIKWFDEVLTLKATAELIIHRRSLAVTPIHTQHVFQYATIDCFKTLYNWQGSEKHFRKQLYFLLFDALIFLFNSFLFSGFFEATVIQVLLLISLFSHVDLIHLLLPSRTSLPHFSELWGTPERFLLPHLGSNSESAIWCLVSTLFIPSAKRSGCFNLTFLFFFPKH